MKEIIEVKEDVRIGDVILEAGDKIKVLKEASGLESRANAFMRSMGAEKAYWDLVDGLDPEALDSALKTLGF